jgi:hypothetical protein
LRLLLHLACTTNHRFIPVTYLLHLLVQEHWGSFLCFLQLRRFLPGMPGHFGTGVFVVEEFYRVGDGWSRYTTTVSVETLSEKCETYQQLKCQGFLSISIHIKGTCNHPPSSSCQITCHSLRESKCSKRQFNCSISNFTSLILLHLFH